MLLYQFYCPFNNLRKLTFFRCLNLTLMTNIKLSSCHSDNLVPVKDGFAFLISGLKIVNKVNLPSSLQIPKQFCLTPQQSFRNIKMQYIAWQIRTLERFCISFINISSKDWAEVSFIMKVAPGEVTWLVSFNETEVGSNFLTLQVLSLKISGQHTGLVFSGSRLWVMLQSSVA